MIRKRVLITRRCRSLDMGRYYVAAGGVSIYNITLHSKEVLPVRLLFHIRGH